MLLHLACLRRFLLGFFIIGFPWFIGAGIFLFLKHDYRDRTGLIACTIAVSISLLFSTLNCSLRYSYFSSYFVTKKWQWDYAKIVSIFYVSLSTFISCIGWFKWRFLEFPSRLPFFSGNLLLLGEHRVLARILMDIVSFSDKVMNLVLLCFGFTWHEAYRQEH